MNLSRTWTWRLDSFSVKICWSPHASEFFLQTRTWGWFLNVEPWIWGLRFPIKHDVISPQLLFTHTCFLKDRCPTVWHHPPEWSSPRGTLCPGTPSERLFWFRNANRLHTEFSMSILFHPLPSYMVGLKRYLNLNQKLTKAKIQHFGIPGFGGKSRIISNSAVLLEGFVSTSGLLNHMWSLAGFY